MRVAGALATAVILAAVAGGCGQQSDESPLMSLRRELPEGTTLLLPSTEPPSLVDAALTSGDGTPIISFYSVNQPIVSVCEAPADRCLKLLPTAQVIPRINSDGDVTVLVEAQENGVHMTLSDELTRYWSEVDLVAGRPAWLDAP
ncbi:MAG: hypothetical protein C0498_03250 [Anaerolinea sp.]|nr:hypothetical protein [Anaerolinea sp.]